MRARILVPFTLLAVTSAVAWPHVATADADATSLRLTEKIVSFTETDLGKKGPTPGDRATYLTHLRDERGRQVGTSPGECVSAVPTADGLGLTHCTATYLLKGGGISTMGPFDFDAKSGSNAIVGGTGLYRGASGQVDFVTKSADTFELTIRLNR